MFVKCCMPTILVSLDACTAETLLQCQRDLEQSVPELLRLCRESTLNLQLICTHRAGPNVKAECGMQLLDPSCKRSHAFCKAHKLAQVQSQCSLLVDSFVTGIIALSVGMQMAGSTSRMRDVLTDVLISRLDIVVGEPPDEDPDAAAYRDAVLDLCLGDTTDQGDDGMTTARLRRKQRLILSSFFRSSDLRLRRIQYVTPVQCSPEDLRTEIREQLVPALLPHRCPVFPRSRWTGADRAVDWVLLLALSFDLLSEVVPRWADMPGEPRPSDAQAASDTASWDDFCLALVSVGVQPAQQHMQQSAGEAEQVPEPTAAMDWSEFNHAMKKKAGHFARMHPGGALALFRPVLQACMETLYHCFWVSSEAFDKTHSTQNANVRCYRVLEELAGKSSLRFFDSLRSVFTSIPKALPKSALAKNMRTLLFTL
ncbi:unnamed protein product, partial [Symbiodinium necroappetens]